MNLRQFFFKLIVLSLVSFYCGAVQAQDAKTYTVKGNEAFGKNRFDEAIEYYTKAIKEDDKFALAYASRGYAYIWNKKMNEITRLNLAIRDCTKAIELQPDSASFYYYRSEAFTEKGWADSAIVDINIAIRLGEGPLNNSKRLIEYYEKRADLYKSEELYYPAIEDYSKLIILDTANVDYYRNRFIAYYNTNQIQLAIQDVSKSIELRPTYYGYYNNRGLCYNSLGEYELAVKDFLTNLNHRLDGGNPYINIISPLVRLNRFNEANFFYNLYLNNKSLYENLPKPKRLPSFLDEPSYKFYKYFIKAVAQVNDNKYDEGLRSLDSASLFYNSRINDTTNKTRRGYIDVLYLRGYILEKLGQIDNAAINYEQSLMIDPRQPDVKTALRNLEIQKRNALVKTRAVDKTAPLINVWSADTVKSKVENTDSIKIKIRGKAADASGISTVKINDAAVGFDGNDGYFEYSLIKKNGDSTDIIITVIDSANVTAKHVISNKATRGGEPENTSMGQEGPGGNYYGILIAETDYINPDFEDLNFPIRDANKLKEILVSKYTFEAKNIDTLYNRSREDIVESIIAKCKALKKDDNLLIFYAGHGDTGRYKTGYIDGYLIPTSAKKGLVSYYITSEEIQKAVLNSNGKHILIMLDACYSGQFLRGQNEDEDILAVKGDEELQWKALSRKVMTSGNLATVPDDSYFIKFVQEFLKDNNKPYVSAKDLWYTVKTKMNSIPEADKSKYHNPQYSALKSIGDEGGSFIFKQR